MSRNKKKTAQENDSSSLKTVSEAVENIKESSSFNEDQYLELKKLKEENEQLKKEVAALRLFVEPDDTEIANLQLELLKLKALKVELTLEEAKKYEIFSKIKMALEEKQKNRKPRPIDLLPSSDSDLLKIASAKVVKKINE